MFHFSNFRRVRIMTVRAVAEDSEQVFSSGYVLAIVEFRLSTATAFKQKSA